MERYISAEKAKEILLKNFPECRNCAEEIDSVPTEDVEPVVHARWIEDEDTDAWKCSECGNEICGYDENPVEYGVVRCYSCGAHMEKERSLWKDKTFFDGEMISGVCPFCGVRSKIKSDFDKCPNCGARMDEVTTDG